jgi:hypothetical protein
MRIAIDSFEERGASVKCENNIRVFTGFQVSGNWKLGNPETYRVYIYNGKV